MAEIVSIGAKSDTVTWIMSNVQLSDGVQLIRERYADLTYFDATPLSLYRYTEKATGRRVYEIANHIVMDVDRATAFIGLIYDDPRNGDEMYFYDDSEVAAVIERQV